MGSNVASLHSSCNEVIVHKAVLLVSSCCHNKITQSGLNNRNLFPRDSENWKVQQDCPQVWFLLKRLLKAGWLPSLCVPSWLSSAGTHSWWLFLFSEAHQSYWVMNLPFWPHLTQTSGKPNLQTLWVWVPTCKTRETQFCAWQRSSWEEKLVFGVRPIVPLVCKAMSLFFFLSIW